MEDCSRPNRDIPCKECGDSLCYYGGKWHHYYVPIRQTYEKGELASEYVRKCSHEDSHDYLNNIRIDAKSIISPEPKNLEEAIKICEETYIEEARRRKEAKDKKRAELKSAFLSKFKACKTDDQIVDFLEGFYEDCYDNF